MSENSYKIIHLVGTSDESREKAARNAIEAASKSIRDLRIAEITKLDMKTDHWVIILWSDLRKSRGLLGLWGSGNPGSGTKWKRMGRVSPAPKTSENKG